MEVGVAKPANHFGARLGVSRKQPVREMELKWEIPIGVLPPAFLQPVIFPPTPPSTFLPSPHLSSPTSLSLSAVCAVVAHPSERRLEGETCTDRSVSLFYKLITDWKPGAPLIAKTVNIISTRREKRGEISF